MWDCSAKGQAEAGQVKGGTNELGGSRRWHVAQHHLSASRRGSAHHRVPATHGVKSPAAMVWGAGGAAQQDLGATRSYPAAHEGSLYRIIDGPLRPDSPLPLATAVRLRRPTRRETLMAVVQ